MSMSPERIQEECKKRKEQRKRIKDRKAKRSAKLRNRQPAKKSRKSIQQSIDVPGKRVSFRPNPCLLSKSPSQREGLLPRMRPSA